VQIALILLGTSFQALATGGFGLVLPAIRRDLGLTYTEAGSLAAAGTLVYALMQVPSGVLADRFGARRLFGIGILGANGLLVLFAASGTYLVAVVIQALAGFSRALAFAPGLVLMSTWFPPGRRATAMGLFVAGGSLWTVLFGVVAPAALEATDWRVVVGVAGLVGLVVAAVFARVGTAGPAADARTQVRAAIPLGSLAREPVIWLASFVQFVRLAVVQGVALWLPTFLIDERGLPLAWAGAVVAASALMTAPSNLVGGFLADRLERPFLVIGGALAALAVALGVLGGVGHLVAVGIAVLVIAVSQQLYFGPLFAAPVAVFGQRSAGVVSGVGNLFANLGAFAAVLALGAIKDRTGSLGLGFGALAALCVLALVATWLLARLVRLRGTRHTLAGADTLASEAER
jgi:nitrate/nitrite transporter NarK